MKIFPEQYSTTENKCQYRPAKNSCFQSRPPALYHRQSAAAQDSCHRLNPSVRCATPAALLFFDKPVFAKRKTAACEKPIARRRHLTGKAPRRRAHAIASILPSGVRHLPVRFFDKPVFAKRKTADDSNRSFEMRRRPGSLLPRSGISPPLHFSRKLRVRPLPRGGLCIIIVVTASDAEALDIEMRFLTCPSN